MTNIYCVLVKPSYKLKHVERLYNQILSKFTEPFTFHCLTDTDYKSIYPINFINVSSYELDTWWNKVLLFDKSISGSDKNLYFDLDINIIGNIDFLLNNITEDSITVVDTVWKNESYFRNAAKVRRSSAFFSYGNSSVLGWIGNSHQFLVDMLFEYPMHTIEHFGDDTYINKYGKIKYFDRKIGYYGRRYDKDVEDVRIWITYKDLP